MWFKRKKRRKRFEKYNKFLKWSQKTNDPIEYTYRQHKLMLKMAQLMEELLKESIKR